MSDTESRPVECPQCRKPMRSGMVKTAMWFDDRLYVIEDIPAQICDSCVEQFYDEDVTDVLRRLTDDGFPSAEVISELTVPVLSLKARLSALASAGVQAIPDRA